MMHKKSFFLSRVFRLALRATSCSGGAFGSVLTWAAVTCRGVSRRTVLVARCCTRSKIIFSLFFFVIIFFFVAVFPLL
jgi:hypothetical protein